MTERCLNNLDITHFLKHIWQRQHLYIADALPDFTSPIDADELAGLALEDSIESRIIVESPAGQWQLKHGPFSPDIYPQLGEQDWTLLVQAVDHYVDEIAELKHYFRFIPDWRLDDIMISFAPEGGSVGPHYDQYDVFLIQASGQRLWKIGQHCDETTALTDNANLKILANFQQQTEYHCKAGDILYVPPGCSHWGISESRDCMTISIGFRAPSHETLIAELCDEVASTLSSHQRYQDQALEQQTHPAQISDAAVEHVKQIVVEHLLNNQQLADTLGKLMTSPKYKYDDTFENTSEAEEPLDYYLKASDARLAYHLPTHEHDNTLRLFANGHSLSLPLEALDLVQALADGHGFYYDELDETSQTYIQSLQATGLFEMVDMDEEEEDIG